MVWPLLIEPHNKGWYNPWWKFLIDPATTGWIRPCQLARIICLVEGNDFEYGDWDLMAKVLVSVVKVLLLSATSCTRHVRNYGCLHVAPEEIVVVLGEGVDGGSGSQKIQHWWFEHIFMFFWGENPWFHLHRSDLPMTMFMHRLLSWRCCLRGRQSGFYWLGHATRVGTLHDENSRSIRTPLVWPDNVGSCA